MLFWSSSQATLGHPNGNRGAQWRVSTFGAYSWEVDKQRAASRSAEGSPANERGSASQEAVGAHILPEHELALGLAHAAKHLQAGGRVLQRSPQ